MSVLASPSWWPCSMLGSGFCVYSHLQTYKAAASVSLPCGNSVRNVSDRPQCKWLKECVNISTLRCMSRVALHGLCGGS